MDLTILIPCKNDKINLNKVINEIKSIHRDVNILVVVEKKDDFDEKILTNFINVSCIIQSQSGYGAALIEGINNIYTKFFIIHNADGSFEVNKIKEMYNSSKHYDFIFCNRYSKNAGSEDDTILTFLGNKVFSNMTKYLLNIKLDDVLYTHVLCNTKYTKAFNLKQIDFTFCIELPYHVFKYKHKVKSIPTFEKKRLSGKKNVNEFKDGFLILIFILKTYILNLFKKN